MKQRAGGVVNHVVFAWMKDECKNEAEINRLIKAEDMLRQIPGLISLTIGRAVPSERSNVDDSFDLASYFRFKSMEAMRKYLGSPEHIEFLNKFAKYKMKKILIYNFQEP